MTPLQPSTSSKNLLEIKEAEAVQDHFRYWEPKDGDIYVDVGAWVGDIIKKLLGFKKNVIVIAIEPRPWGVLELKRRLKNKLGENLIVVCKGASNKSEKAILDCHGSGDIVSEETYHRKLESGATFDKFIEIEVDTLDNILESLGIKEVDFVKIDTDGHEPQVLEGFTKFKKGTKLHIEFHYRNDGQILKILSEKGISVIDMIYWKHEQRKTFGEIWAEVKP